MTVPIAARWPRPRLALLAFLAALAAVHAVAAWWQPLQSDDWEHLLWDARHDGGWLAGHFTMADAIGYVIAHSALAHALVCGAAAAAIALGGFVVAYRRMPRADSWDDVVAVIAVSALIWIAQPRPGFVWFHRSNVAWHVCGCAVALWLIAPFRCGWRVGRAGAVALVVAGWLAGTSSRQIALVTLIGMALAIRRTPPRDRARWMWLALGGLFAGTVVGFLDPPYIEPARVWNRGFEPNLIVLNGAVRKGGGLIALFLLLALARLLIDALRRDVTPRVELPPPRESYTWFWTWAVLVVLYLVGPRFGDAILLPATLVLVIAALPYLPWLSATAAMRRTVIAIVVGIHLIAWPTALLKYAELGGEFHDRVARLERTPPGAVAVIPPYTAALPTSWSFGEDWNQPSRQLVGIEVYGVRDIAFAPRFGRLEDNPQIAIALESDGLTPAQVRSASPVYWATDPTSAREQFEAFVERARREAGRDFTARLIASFDFAERRGRPVLIAWYDRGMLTAPKVNRSNPDPNDNQRITLPAGLAGTLREAYVVRGTGSEKADHDGAAYHVQSLVAGMVAITACSPERCLMVDAWVPRF